MRHMPSYVRAVVVAVLAAPLAVIGPAAVGVASADALIPTRVVLGSLPDNPVAYRTDFSIHGQVVYTDPEDGEDYAAEGQVVLEQRDYGSSYWATVDSTYMSGFFPAFDFDVLAQRIREYRVRFVGDQTYATSSKSALVKVSRKVTGKITEPRDNVFYLVGKVSPSYFDRPVSLMRQKCSTCRWRTYATKDTTATGNYRFRLPLPRDGIHYFKAKVPGDTEFVRSYSPTWHLIRIL